MLELIHEHRIQIISIVGSFSLLLFIFRLIQRKKLKEEYSLLWLGFGFGFLILSVFRPLLDEFAQVVGIHYPPAALLLFLIITLVAVLIQFSLVMSKLSERNKVLVQEMALLKHEIKEIKSSHAQNSK